MNQNNFNLQDFKTNEIKSVKKLKVFFISFLLLINIMIVGFFVYMFYDVYKSRHLTGNFITYIFPTVAYIQLILALVFAPLILIIDRRLSSFYREISDLNSDFISHFQRYAHFINRIFVTVPLYLISQKGLLIFRNFKTDLLLPDSIKSVTIKNVKMGRFRRCTIHISQKDGSKSKIIYHTYFPKEAEFFKDNIHLINNDVWVENHFNE